MCNRRFLGAVALIPVSVWMILAAGAAPVRAQTQALDFTGGSAAFVSGDVTYGWNFTVSSPFLLTDLGIFDNGSDGLSDAHNVGLWDSSGTLLASTTFSSGVSGSSVVPSISGFGSYQYNSVASSGVHLTPGTTYTVGAEYNSSSDPTYILANTPTTVANFTYAGSTVSPALGFTEPTNSSLSNSFFGPDLRVSSTAPEPGSFALISIGLMGMAAPITARRSRRRRSWPSGISSERCPAVPSDLRKQQKIVV